jgi:hypothetical protein
MYKAAALLIFTAFATYGFFSGANEYFIKRNIEGNKIMTAQTDSLPFDLSKDDLPSVNIFFAYYSAKTGAGKQEIIIMGNGAVKLVYTKSMYDEKPETRDGKISLDNIIHLLDVLEEENIFALEDHYPTKGDPRARRILRLSLPGRTKTVIMEGSCVPEFERMTGAIKFAVGTALPEVFQHRFFPNL